MDILHIGDHGDDSYVDTEFYLPADLPDGLADRDPGQVARAIKAAFIAALRQNIRVEVERLAGHIMVTTPAAPADLLHAAIAAAEQEAGS